MAIRGDLISKLVVIREMISQNLESANSRDLFFRRDHHRAEHEIEPTHQPSHQDARGKIGAVAKRFHPRPKRTIGKAFVEAGNSSDLRVREGRHHLAKEFRLNSNIAIAHQ